jgi:hypothetical protein
MSETPSRLARVDQQKKTPPDKESLAASRTRLTGYLVKSNYTTVQSETASFI